MRQLSSGAEPAGTAHAARRALSTQGWGGRSGASGRATLAYASRGDADDLRETRPGAVTEWVGKGCACQKKTQRTRHIATHRAAKGDPIMRRKNMEIVVMTMNVTGLTHKEFRAILDEMGVEARPEPGIYQHISHPTETGFRIIEIWESQKG